MTEFDSRMMMSQLGGIVTGLVYSDKAQANAAIVHLSTCKEHFGEHHFAVTYEGRGVWCSSTGFECLEKAGLA